MLDNLIVVLQFCFPFVKKTLNLAFTMADLEQFRRTFWSLVQNNGISAVLVLVVVIHGFTTKFLAWMNKKGNKILFPRVLFSVIIIIFGSD